MILSKIKCAKCGGTLRVHGYHTKINRNENLEITMTVDPCTQCLTDEYCKGSADTMKVTIGARDAIRRAQG